MKDDEKRTFKSIKIIRNKCQIQLVHHPQRMVFINIFLEKNISIHYRLCTKPNSNCFCIMK